MGLEVKGNMVVVVLLLPLHLLLLLLLLLLVLVLLLLLRLETLVIECWACGPMLWAMERLMAIVRGAMVLPQAGSRRAAIGGFK